MPTPSNTETGSEICSIGIDLGGTKIAAGLVSFPSAKILVKEIIPTLPARGGQAVLDDIIALAQRLKNQAATFGLPLQGIGLGIAELVNREGKITSEYLFNWRSLPAQEALSQVAPTRFESDARAPAIAEAHFGSGKDFRNFVYVTVGTGISYCLMLDKKPYLGAHGHAIILASGALTSRCEQCGTVQHQVLEEFAAGPSLVRRYAEQSGRPVTTGQEVTAAAAAGDAIATEVIRSSGEALGNSVGFLVNVIDPEAVVVGGGLGMASGLYWDTFVAATRNHIWSDVSKNLPILKAGLGPNAGLIGAAAVAWKNIED
jgi:glucokinase